MKQLAQYQDGRLEIQDVPIPQPPPGGILVKTSCSVISPGTEKMKLEQAKMSLLQKAKARPDQVRKVIDSARTLGWKSAIEKVRNRLESPTPLGYSAAGTVVAVDPLNQRFHVGQRVACGGAECAYHAEFIAIPDLLAAPVPSEVVDSHAAYTTLAAIALEAVRQAGTTLGEHVMVIGQGLVGLLVTNILAASGARVLAVDLDDQPLATAQRVGAELTLNASNAKLADVVWPWTDGSGVDRVVLCVGGDSKNTIENCIDSLRDRGTLVIVGMYDVTLPWRTAYAKDIQVKYSRSYGPGRYDPNYEWAGNDYPLGYVRWTENRNFEACLHLMKTGVLKLDQLTTKTLPFDQALSAYGDLLSTSKREIGIILQYTSTTAEIARIPSVGVNMDDPIQTSVRVTDPIDTVNVIGAGNFVRTMLLPYLKGRVKLGTVINSAGLSSRHTMERFGFDSAETDANKLLCSNGGAVIIGTRHHLHASMVLQGLQHHKHLFVEKPLCLTPEELTQIKQTVAESAGSVMVGFNRRFAPATREIQLLLSHQPGPRTISYHVNAGKLDPDHWYARREESGGRVIGEACHMIDLACQLIPSSPVSVFAQRIAPDDVSTTSSDSFSAQIAFADGSHFHLVYSAEGSASFPKEVFRLSTTGLVLECENFTKVNTFYHRQTKVSRHTSKGHAEELAAWLSFLEGKTTHPMPMASVHRAMMTTFAISQSIREARIIYLGVDSSATASSTD
ncbi:MAG: bi-domain-containing oxidoreductase [Verrucomicrobiaceae bacterium]|nr:bi-domain-containing oxidoreductase [Verrucomicrobiaceae bacterium]